MQQNESGNPYRAPSVGVVAALPEGDGAFIPGGRAVAAGRGWDWIVAGWGYFTQAPLIWIVNMIILFVIHIVLTIIPLLGSLLGPVFNGGLMMGCHAGSSGRPLQVDDLFAGFSEKTGSLLTVGVLNIVAWIAVILFAVILVFMVLGTGTIIGALQNASASSMDGIAGSVILGIIMIVLLSVAVSIPIAMAFWFASTLVALQTVSATEAIRMSFTGCLKNILPFLVYGIVFLVLSILTIFTFGLGVLVVVPLLFTSTYAAYRDIFLAD